MKHKFISIFIALVLACSLCLVTVAVSANPGGSIELESESGVAEWSTDCVKFGNYSAFLSVQGGMPSEAKVMIPYGDTLSSITSLSFWTNIKTLAPSETMSAEAGRVYWADGVVKEGGPGPYIVLELDKDGDGSADDWLVLWHYGEDRTGEWVERSLTEGFHTSWGDGYGVGGVTGQNYWHSVNSSGLATWDLPITEGYAALKLGTLADWQGTQLGSARVLKVKIDIGCWTLEPLMEAYVDDITINDVLYELEPSAAVDMTNEATEPAVTTTGVTDIDVWEATLHGELTDMGGATEVVVSFVYGTAPGSDTFETSTSAMDNIGAFSADAINLIHNTTYYFRAKGEIEGGLIVYGDELSFTTLTEQIGISVDPTSIDFGTRPIGQPSDSVPVVVTNTGDVSVDLDATIENELVAGVYTDGLKMDGNSVAAYAVTIPVEDPDASTTTNLILTVPLDTPPGTYTATLVFWAEETP